MITVALDFDAEVFNTLHMAPAEFTNELRIAACIHWYTQGKISWIRAAELAGLTRQAFLDELMFRQVSTGSASTETNEPDNAHKLQKWFGSVPSLATVDGVAWQRALRDEWP
ncbi:MAG: UPF0175 family protein [Magnetococcales bacterium]|nr:UPF0175 family protein [Magnetococcales bacterium]